jgi:hypothetical protein
LADEAPVFDVDDAAHRAWRAEIDRLVERWRAAHGHYRVIDLREEVADAAAERALAR